MADDHIGLTVLVNGVRAKRLTSITFRTESGNIRVETLDGFAGFSDGSGICGLALESAIPASGQEFPYQQQCANKEWITIQVPLGGDGSYVGIGKWMDTEMSQSVNAAAGQTMNWDGELAPIS